MKLNSTICITCKYYYQHYIYFENKLSAINCGHCSCRENKKRSTTAKEFCEYYAPKKVVELSHENIEQVVKAIKIRLDEIVSALTL